MTPFATFGVLYMTAIFLELAEKWTYPLFTLATLLLVALILTVRVTRITFLIFLAVTTSHFLLVQFPDVANHVNVVIYCNLLMAFGIIYSLARRNDFPTDDDYYAMMRPLLQATMILTYFLAGFHKLNTSFFNPDVSCVLATVEALSRIASSELVMIPVSLILMVSGLALYQRFSSNRGQRSLAVALGLVGLTALAALLLLRLPLGFSPAAAGPVIVVTAVVVVVWEILGGPLLVIPRLQAALLAFSWAMHSTLAFIGFVDFGGLALALLYTFVPQAYLDRLNGRLRVPVLGISVHRAHLYFGLNILTGIVSALYHRSAAGLLFNLAALTFIWPALSPLAGPRPRPSWAGVPLSNRMTPRWMFGFPAFLLLHGLSSYVGLRTAGNFSMFSNLRTEGPTSNHLLLGKNQLKLWGYQEDVVRFIDIDDRRATIGYQYQPLKGNQLPVVEFRKLIHAWTKAGATIPMTFEYRDRIYSTDDIVADPIWRTNVRDWEMVLLDFRVIQPGGPNRCRW